MFLLLRWKQSELVREAVYACLDKQTGNERAETLRDLADIWKDRDDLPDFTEIRSQWDRADAGQTIEHGLHPATLNVKHFPMFPGLKPAYQK
ncbi:MAG: hypothetical protein EA383_15700 [Spirochaetaceae bacterium]|nr:MAG: hypothetical protein EA383_15700 [Spirochaetaceae bacterium]